MKRVLLIATGGTIASKMTDGGLSPQIDADEMLGYVPEVRKMCHVDTVQLYNLDSTNIDHEHWCGMARCIRDRYEGYDGFVLTHGTDTMAYTAAALSYLIQKSPKPIVLTGAQQPIGMQETDARINLRDSFIYAADNEACGVHLVFGGRVIVGTRARKTRTKSYNSFSSVDYPEVARVWGGRIVRFIKEKADGMTPVFSDRMDPGVFVLKLIPGIRADVITSLGPHYRALVIESFGVGGIPNDGGKGFMAAIEEWTRSGRVLVMSTQVPHEGVDLELYEVGVSMKRSMDVLEAQDMTLEAVVTKLMWILGQTHQKDEIMKLLYRPVQKDILLSAQP